MPDEEIELGTVEDAPIVESSPTPASEAENTPEPTVEEPKKDNGVQKRINQITREKHEARQEADRQKEANAALTKRLEALEAPKTELSQPQENDFTDYNEYQQANSNYVVEKATQGAYDKLKAESLATEKANRAAEVQNSFNTKIEGFHERVAEKQEHYQDYEQVAYGHSFMDQDLAGQLCDMDKGVEVGYHLGANLDVAEKIFALDPVSRARELTKLEFQVESVAGGKKVSDAPDPIVPLGSSETVSKDEKDMSDDEWWAGRYAQLNARNNPQ